jgi:CheY-like chemotaxis protein
MVSALGGTITIERASPRGTTATVRLPRAAPPSLSAPAVAPSARFAGAKILVIDDQPNVVTTLRLLLDECAVTGALSASEAYAELAKRRFDLVLCDIVMPDVNGVGIFNRLEETAPEVLPRLVFMTGGSTMPEISSFLSRIPNRCLQKPFTEEELRRAIASTLAAAPAASLPAVAADAAGDQ